EIQGVDRKHVRRGSVRRASSSIMHLPTTGHFHGRTKTMLGKLTMVAVPALATVAPQASAQTRGVTKTEIVLGMHTDLSGVAATYGVSSSNAVKMRFDEANEAGGIDGRNIKWIVEDTQYQVPRAVQAGAKLINRDKIFAMVAGLGTPMNNALL